MNSNERHIANKINSKLDELSYPYDENAWDEMESLLDSNEKPTAGFWYRYRYAIGALLIVILAGLPFLIVPKSNMDLSNAFKGVIHDVDTNESVDDTHCGRKPNKVSCDVSQSIDGNKGVERSKVNQHTTKRTDSNELQDLNIRPLFDATLKSHDLQNDVVKDAIGIYTADLIESKHYLSGKAYFEPGIILNKVEIASIEVVNKPKKQPKIIKKERPLKIYRPEGKKIRLIPTKWGAKLGTSLARLTTKEIGFLAGLYFTYPLPGPLTLQVETDYRSINGYSIANQYEVISDGILVNVETEITGFDVFDLKFISQLRLSTKSKVELGGSLSYLRPYMGFSMSGNSTFSYRPQNSDGITPFTYSLIVGYEYKLSPRFRLSARYNYGLKDISKNKWFDNNKIHRVSDLQLAVKYQFNKSKGESR